MKRFVSIFVVVLFLLLSINLGVVSAEVSKLRISDTALNQLTWKEANNYCEFEEVGARLPTIFELVAIAWLRKDVLMVSPTDYWSANAIGEWAFGYNTKSHILSFDRKNDQDHVFCVVSLS